MTKYAKQNNVYGWFKNYYKTIHLLYICTYDNFLVFFALQGILTEQNKALLKFPLEKPCLLKTGKFRSIVYTIISQDPL